MLKSPDTFAQIPSTTEANIEAFIHGWTPHSSLTLTAISVVFFVAVVLVVAALHRQKMNSTVLIRAGFAAGPIPVYFILPMAAYDGDLVPVLLGQPLSLFFAAVIGIRWTVSDILDLTRNGSGRRH